MLINTNLTEKEWVWSEYLFYSYSETKSESTTSDNLIILDLVLNEIEIGHCK